MIHPATRRGIEQMARQLPQAIILEGKAGSGLVSVAKELAEYAGAELVWVSPERKEQIDEEGGVIGVDVIRRLRDQTRVALDRPRLVIVKKAHTMSHQAQNAFLKLLEEPAANVHFVLLVEGAEALLPTVTSRAQTLEVRPLSREQSEQLLREHGITDPVKISQLLFLAEGLSEKLLALASDEALFGRGSQVIVDGRELLKAKGYDALKILDAYKDDRARAIALLEASMRLIELSVAKTADTRLLKRLERFLEVHEALSRNGNVRLQLASLVV